MAYLNLHKLQSSISVLSYSNKIEGFHSWDISDPKLRGKILLKLIPKINKFYMCGTLETKALYSIEPDILVSVVDEVFGIKPLPVILPTKTDIPWDAIGKCFQAFIKMCWTLCWVSLKIIGVMILGLCLLLKLKK